MFRKFAPFAVFAFILAISASAFAAYPVGEDAVVAAVKKVKPSVVSILTTYKSGKEGGGSGVILTKDGFILTNAHVIDKAKTIQVGLSNGKKFSAVIVGSAKHKDLAVIKVKANGLPVPAFGNSSKLELGQTAIAIGNPLKFQWSVTVGCISAMNRDIKTRGIMYRDLIQTDAAINPGSSGGSAQPQGPDHRHKHPRLHWQLRVQERPGPQLRDPDKQRSRDLKVPQKGGGPGVSQAMDRNIRDNCHQGERGELRPSRQERDNR